MGQFDLYTAIIPAAGKGTRMRLLIHSKELLAVGAQTDGQSKPIATYLFDRLKIADILTG